VFILKAMLHLNISLISRVDSVKGQGHKAD